MINMALNVIHVRACILPSNTKNKNQPKQDTKMKKKLLFCRRIGAEREKGNYSSNAECKMNGASLIIRECATCNHTRQKTSQCIWKNKHKTERVRENFHRAERCDGAHFNSASLVAGRALFLSSIQ